MRSKNRSHAANRSSPSIKKGKNSEQQSVQRLSRQIASRRQLLDETESQLSLLAEQLAASDSTAGAPQRPAGTLPRPICGDGTRSLPQLQAEQLPDLYLRLEGFRRRGASHRQHPRRGQAARSEAARDRRDGAGGGTAAGAARRAAAGARLHTPQDRRPTGPLRTRPAQRQGTTATHVGARKGRTARKGAAGGAARHGHRRIAETHQGQQGGSLVLHAHVEPEPSRRGRGA